MAKVYFHYTSHLGFRNITDPAKESAEVFASMNTPHPDKEDEEDKKNLNAYWGKGVYAVRRSPDQWGHLDVLLDNNYGKSKKNDPHKKIRAEYCIPILANDANTFDVRCQQTPEMREQRKPPGANLDDRLIKHREVFVLRMQEKGDVSNAKANLLQARQCY